jgi:hypothetical protein
VTPRKETEGRKVFKVVLPQRLRRPGRLTETIEAKPKPPQPDDPRDAAHRNAPGAWG